MILNKIKIILILVILIITYLFYLNYKSGTVIISEKYNNTSSVEQAFPYNPENNLKVMTYNIRYGRGIDNELDLNRIVKIIENSEAQIITLNEVDQRMPRSRFQNQIKIMAERLNMNYIYGPNLQTGIGGYGNAILTEFPVYQANNYLLPYNKIGSEPRGLLKSIIQLPNQQKLQVMTTHLTLNPDERDKQIEWIKRFIEKSNFPYLLMGDFNTELNSFAGFTSLISKNTFPSDNPTHNIDLIFTDYNYLQLSNSYTIETKSSDHLPVIAEFIFSKNV